MPTVMTPGHARVFGGNLQHNRRRRFRVHCHFGFLVLLLILALAPGFADEDATAATTEDDLAASVDTTAPAGGAGESSPAGLTSDSAKANEKSEKKETTDNAQQERKKPPTPRSDDEEDWGSFYDPNNIFCGKYDCYKILSFDHESWGRNPPSLRDITKSYRSLSRKWHPDKNKAKGAREKFVKIAKAYEILTDVAKRAEYDHFRDRPDEYFQKYGSSVLWSYAPQSDARAIVVLFLLLGSAFTYYAQKKKWQTIADHIVKAAVEDLSTREGGSTESFDIRERAMELLEKKREAKEEEEDRKKREEVVSNGNSTVVKKQKGPKLTSREKREKEQDELRPFCVKLVSEVDDFGGGFRKPTLHDLLIVKLVKMPYHVTKSTAWWSKYAIRRLKKVELSEEEREILTKNAVGDVGWAAAANEDRAEMLTLDLWVVDNLVEWRGRQEMKNQRLSANWQKKVGRMKKRGVSKLD